MKELDTNSIREIIPEMLHDAYIVNEDGTPNIEEIKRRTLDIVRSILKNEKSQGQKLKADVVLNSLASAFSEEGITGTIDDYTITFPNLEMDVKIINGKKRNIRFKSFGNDPVSVGGVGADTLRLVPRMVTFIHSEILSMVTPERLSKEKELRAKKQIALQKIKLEKQKYMELKRYTDKIESLLKIVPGCSNDDVYSKEKIARILKETYINEAKTELDRKKADQILEHAISNMYIQHVDNIVKESRIKIREDIIAGRCPDHLRKPFLEKLGPVLEKRRHYDYQELVSKWEMEVNDVRKKWTNYRRRHSGQIEFDKRLARKDTVLEMLVKRGWRLEMRPNTRFRGEHGVLFMSTANGQVASFISDGNKSLTTILMQARTLVPALDKLEGFCFGFKVMESSSPEVSSGEALTDSLNQRFTQSGYHIIASATKRKREIHYFRQDGTVLFARIRPDVKETDADALFMAIREFVKLDVKFFKDHPDAGSISFNMRPEGEMRRAKECITPPFED